MCTPSTHPFDQEVDNCVFENYQVFYKQAFKNIKSKYPYLSDAHVGILAKKFIIVVKENIKLNEAMKEEEMRVIRNKVEKLEVRDGQDLRKRCLISNAMRKVHRNDAK